MVQEMEIFNEKDIIEKLRRLESDQLSEVINFIQFITEKKEKSSFVEFISEIAGPSKGLDELRNRLSKIPGKMSETVRELRDERG